MSDLTDALDSVKPGSVIAWWLEGDGRALAAAARSVADAPEWLQRLLEDPPPEPDEVWWCLEHEYSGYDRACLYPWWYALENKLAPTHPALAEARNTCRMVRRRLLEAGER